MVTILTLTLNESGAFPLEKVLLPFVELDNDREKYEKCVIYHVDGQMRSQSGRAIDVLTPLSEEEAFSPQGYVKCGIYKVIAHPKNEDEYPLMVYFVVADLDKKKGVIAIVTEVDNYEIRDFDEAFEVLTGEPHYDGRLLP